MEAGVIVAHRHRDLRAVPRGADGPDHPAGTRGRRGAPRALPAHAHAGARDRRAVRRPRPPAHRPPRAGRDVQARGRHHRRQRRHPDRLRPVLHDHRRQVRLLRGRQPAAGDRAAHRHDAAQRHRRAHARGDADEPRRDQRRAADGARRGDRPVGHPRQPRRGQGDRPARHHPGGDGEADARRARPPRRDPHRRGPQAVRDPQRRGRAPGRGAPRRGQQGGGDPAAEGEAQAIDTVFRAIHEGGPDQGLLSYQYLQMLPQLAQGEANKIFVIPSEFTQALGGLSSALGNADRTPRSRRRPTARSRPPSRRSRGSWARATAGASRRRAGSRRAPACRGPGGSRPRGCR